MVDLVILTIYAYEGEGTTKVGSITLLDGKVTTTGLGERMYETVVVFEGGKGGNRRLGPADGRDWFVEMQREIERSGYFLTHLDD